MLVLYEKPTYRYLKVHNSGFVLSVQIGIAEQRVLQNKKKVTNDAYLFTIKH